MQVTIEELNTTRRGSPWKCGRCGDAELDVRSDGQREAKLKGFRPGRAPRSVSSATSAIK